MLACLVNLAGPPFAAWKFEHIYPRWVRISLSPPLFPDSFLLFFWFCSEIQGACGLVFCVVSSLDLCPPSVSCLRPPPRVNLVGKRVAALTSSPLPPNPSPKSKSQSGRLSEQLFIAACLRLPQPIWALSVEGRLQLISLHARVRTRLKKKKRKEADLSERVKLGFHNIVVVSASNSGGERRSFPKAASGTSWNYISVFNGFNF